MTGRVSPGGRRRSPVAEVEALLRRGSPLTIAQIAERAGMSGSLANRAIKKLIADGVPVKSEKGSWGALIYRIDKEGQGDQSA